MRQMIRRVIVLISLMLFPLTFNYFSPYISIDGALIGVITGSLLIFIIQLISAIFLGRLWCAWLCPVAGLGEAVKGINNKNVKVKKLKIVRYFVFSLWFTLLVFAFIMAGGIKGINPWHLTESLISIDEPIKYITYYLVLAIIFLTTILLGRRGFCHSLCWMSPFMVFGQWLGAKLRIPRLKIASEADKCINCLKCNRVCPMSIDVREELKIGHVASSDCINCCECVDVCPKGVLKVKVKG